MMGEDILAAFADKPGEQKYIYMDKLEKGSFLKYSRTRDPSRKGWRLWHQIW